MDHFLITLFLAIFVSTVLNIIFKRFGISQIIGYILTGTLISYWFHFNGVNIHSLEAIAEFGIVFLMFTIGLEISVDKIKRMKEILLLNGFLQVSISAILIYLVGYYIFELEPEIAVIVALAFSLSSTAIVLTYLKQSKDIHTPYGEKATAILIFQDLAVIPILLLISFLSNDTLAIEEVITKTLISAILIILYMFVIGKKVINWLLKFASNSSMDEIFLGAVLSIVVGASLLAEELGFTYSLGAFIAGMIIADTDFSIKVESEIASFKDLLLGTFFFSVGSKIDILYFFHNLHLILAIFVGIMIIKALVVYVIIRRKSDKSISVKTAISLCQVGEFSFVIFTLASSKNIIPAQTADFLMLISVLSMILTPFIVNNIYKLSAFIAEDYFESDNITPLKDKNHVVVCGFSILGKVIAMDLTQRNIPFVIITNDLRQVLTARKLGYRSYFGHLNKRQVLESLKVDEASSVIVTVSDTPRKRLICEAVLNFHKEASILLKIESVEEKLQLKDLNIKRFVHAHTEVGRLLVEEAAIDYENSKK